MHPFQNYKINNINVKGIGEGQINDLTWVILDSLAAQIGLTKEARESIELYTQSLYPDEAELLKAIVIKKLRMGLGPKEVNTVFPDLIPTHDVMLAFPVEWFKVKFPCLSSPKLDGLRAIYRDGVFRTRNGKVILGMDHIIHTLRGAPVLDGELIIPDKTFYAASGDIRSYRACPTAVYNIFEVPYYPSPELQSRLYEAAKYVGPHVHLVPHDTVNSKDEALESYSICRNIGLEGIVLKPFMYEYVGTRSYSWMKVKPKETIDARILDFYEGTGRNTNSLGGVIINFNGVRVRVGGGFSDKQRQDIYHNFENYRDMYIELDYHEITPDGSLREPRFKRFRYDK